MITFILIFWVAFFKAIADVIKVPAVINNSFFARYKDNKWVNPAVSWTNQYKFGKILYPIWVHFSDLWHFCNSCMIGGFFLVALTFKTDYFFSDVTMFFVMFLAYGVSFEWWLLVIKSFKKG